jgi:uncharacterized delta-60 repeat protein
MDVARRVRRTGLLCAAIVALGASVAAALPGDLDPSFNGGGTRFFHYGGGLADSAASVLIQPGGKIILSGAGDQPGDIRPDAVVSRLNLNGSTDTSFGASGTGATSLDFGQSFTGGDAAFAPDGKIVVTGLRSNDGNTFTQVAGRLNADGTPDTTFGPGGTRVLLPNGPAFVAVQSTGKPVILGENNNGQWIVSRLTTGGIFDSTFGGPGHGQTVIPIAGPHAGIAVDTNDKIVAVGSEKGANGFNLRVGRLNADGTPDSSFGTGGVTGAGAGFASGVAVQPDHRIVIIGEAPSGLATQVVRLNSDGSPDMSFGTGGMVNVNFANAGPVAIQPDGKILAAGETGSGDFAIARLQPGGALDTTFSSDGQQTVDFAGDTSVVDGLAVEPNGAIVLAGQKGTTGNVAVAVARLQGDAAGKGGGPGGGGGAGGNGSPPRCGGRRATIVGTSHGDHLRGTRRADVIAGLGGNDRISGLGGNDIICGGSGNDTISGGAGKDKLYGQNGKDKLSGGSGNDKLSGGAGNDKLSGGSGKDSLSGGAGKDKLSGGSGKDSLNGGSGKDSCSGHDRKKSC